MTRNTRQPGGLESLLGALQSGKHQRHVEDPSTLANEETIQDGNGILLGGLLGGGKPNAGMAEMVEGFLDSDGDGAVVDDILSMAKKFL